MRRTVWAVGSLVGVMVGLSGCGGVSSDSSTGSQSPYKGTYNGSATDGTTISSVSFTFNNDGTLSGTSKEIVGGNQTSTFTGTVTGLGTTNLSITNSSGPATVAAGTFAQPKSGELSATFNQAGGGGSSTVTISNTNDSTEYAGTFNGTYTSTGSAGTGTATISVTSSGTVTGTLAPSGGTAISIAGTVNSSGVASIVLTPSGGSADQTSGGAAYLSNGKLLVVLDDTTSSAVTTITVS